MSEVLKVKKNMLFTLFNILIYKFYVASKHLN